MTCQKSLKNINNRRKFIKNHKKYSKTVKDSLKKPQKPPKKHGNMSKIRLKT